MKNCTSTEVREPNFEVRVIRQKRESSKFWQAKGKCHALCFPLVLDAVPSLAWCVPTARCGANPTANPTAEPIHPLACPVRASVRTFLVSK